MNDRERIIRLQEQLAFTERALTTSQDEYEQLFSAVNSYDCDWLAAFLFSRWDTLDAMEDDVLVLCDWLSVDVDTVSDGVTI